MTLAAFDRILLVACLITGFAIGAWSLWAGAFFFSIALLLTARLHSEACSNFARAGQGSDRRG